MLFTVRAVTKSDQKAAIPWSINFQHTFMLGCWNGIVHISGTTQTSQMSTPRWEGPAKIETSKDAGIEVRWSTLEPSHVPVVCKEPYCMSVVVVCGMRRDETSLPAPRKQHTASLIKFGEQCYGSSYVQISTGITNTLDAVQPKA